MFHGCLPTSVLYGDTYAFILDVAACVPGMRPEYVQDASIGVQEVVRRGAVSALLKRLYGGVFVHDVTGRLSMVSSDLAWTRKGVCTIGSH